MIKKFSSCIGCASNGQNGQLSKWALVKMVKKLNIMTNEDFVHGTHKLCMNL